MFNKERRTNPYKSSQPKPAKPLARGQSTLSSFFGGQPTSSLNVKLNRSQSAFSPPPLATPPSALKRTSSLLLKKTHSTLEGFTDYQRDGDDDDIVEIKPPINNFKHTVLLPSPLASRNSSFGSSDSSQLQAKRSGSKLDQNTVRANILNSIKSKADSQSKKRINPWANGPINVKNPRLKESLKKGFIIDTSGSGIKLSEEQLNVINIAINERKNIFYTGSAGTGKSVLLRELVRQLKEYHGENAVAVTASTGLAAVNIGGVTINRFSGCGLAKQSKHSLATMVKNKQEARDRWKHTKVLIIDEVSMLDGDFLDKLEYVASEVTGSKECFGGIQIILTGDFFQLPPVPDKGKEIKFCFEAECWSRVIDEKILLKKVFRQKDTAFVDLLNTIRTGLVNPVVEKEFRSLSRDIQYNDGIQPTELYPTRYEVENANRSRLDRLPGEIIQFKAVDVGTVQDPKAFDTVMALKELTLKIDAQVMMLKNMDETLVNGSVGKVIAFVNDKTLASYCERIPIDRLDTPSALEDLHHIFECVKQGKVPESVELHAERSCFIQKEKFLMICKAASHMSIKGCYPLVRFSVAGGGTRVSHVIPEDFPLRAAAVRGGEVEAKRQQLPLLLSWALSIHKSQGQTLDRVKVDLRKIFEAGQVYVALSRAVSKERLQVLNFERNKIMINKRVALFYQNMEQTS
ncbi:hypothetical protein WICPIJ_004979 [Wickerhamomyces pijperi]|uniref:ATP-dependent DNA helicase PIF1 n=1 Tax=Wickerhamomyces pijperi TaxID=599730 RepID=A0A9P8Q4R9_WICPI|nr:hypothetical protein WICPIJ_004979 [Wickerhamomyces pijperi]